MQNILRNAIKLSILINYLYFTLTHLRNLRFLFKASFAALYRLKHLAYLNFNPLANPCSCESRFVSDMVADSKDRFSSDGIILR